MGANVNANASGEA